MSLAITYSPGEVEAIQWRVRHFTIEWLGETPLRLHAHTNTDGAAPDFSPEFNAYLEGSLAWERHRNDRSRRIDLYDSPRSRVTRAFRKLRWKAPREYFVLSGMCVIDQVGRDIRPGDEEAMRLAFEASLRRTTRRLNDAILRSPIPEPLLTEPDVLLLTVSGVSKLVLWAG